MAATIRLTVLTGPHKGTRFCTRGLNACLVGRSAECQGQLQLNRCARNDFQQEIIAPTAAASLHHGALLLVRMLF
jgi:hypothetical protein